MNSLRILGRIDDIPDGGARGFDPAASGRDALFVVRRGAVLRGWLDRCPHEGATPLPYKRHVYLNKAGTRIDCFAHGAQFEIDSGRCVSGPCLGEALTPVPLQGLPDGRLLAAPVWDIAPAAGSSSTQAP